MGWFITGLIFKGACSSTVRLDGKTAVVTGCNTGLGKETVREFYKRGARVVMACRDTQKAEQASEDIRKSAEGLHNVGMLAIYKLDLGSLESVRQCAKEILEKEQQINLLVNNAGIMACPKYLSKDGYELQFATNHLGHFLFTLLLLPRILKSAPARIVILASSAHIMGDGKMHFEDINLDKPNSYTPWGAYGRSKTANILFAAELARRLKNTAVNTYAVHPGVIETELGRHLESTNPWRTWIIKSFSRPFLKSLKQGIQTSLYCSFDEKCANESGLYYADCMVCTPFPRARNEETSKRLWDESLKIVKLENYDSFTPA